jgi:hypothetical protein
MERREPIDRLIFAHRIDDGLVERWPFFVHGSLDPFQDSTLTCKLRNSAHSHNPHGFSLDACAKGAA